MLPRRIPGRPLPWREKVGEEKRGASSVTGGKGTNKSAIDRGENMAKMANLSTWGLGRKNNIRWIFFLLEKEKEGKMVSNKKIAEHCLMTGMV